jgi:hypothetical protein
MGHPDLDVGHPVYSWLPFAPPLTATRKVDTKVSVDSIVQLFYSLASGLIAIVPGAR